MTCNVARHSVGLNFEAFSPEKVEKWREKWRNHIEGNPQSVDAVVGSLYIDLQFSTAQDPDVELLTTWETSVAAMQMYHAMFKVATNPAGRGLESLFGHGTLCTTTAGSDPCFSANNWIRAFCLAIICRDEEKWRALCQIPVASLRYHGESDGTRYNPFTYHWISVMQAFALNREDFGSELFSAMELSAPDRVDFGDSESLDMLTFPPMSALLRLAERDTEKFNKSLAQGLELFRDYHSATVDRACHVSGVVPLELVALSCLAHDIAYYDEEFDLEAESGYLPKCLVQGFWRGEFPT